MVKRREFEALTRRHLDATLNCRGFVLSPQPPPDHEDAQPRAIYEDDPGDNPARRTRARTEASRNEVEIQFEPARGQLLCHLDGHDLSHLLTALDTGRHADQLTDRTAGDLAAQFDIIEAGLRHVLDAHTPPIR